MAVDESEEILLQRIRERAKALLDGMTRDEQSLRDASATDRAHAEGAALWEQAAADARRLIAEAEKQPETERPQP